MNLPREQILEWTENPVTKLLKRLAEKEIEALEEGCTTSQVFHPFEPQRTQEVMAGLNGAIDTWMELVETLEGEGLFDADSSTDEDEV